MRLCGSDQNKERLASRLRPIEGQVRGLCAMVEQDRDTPPQIPSATGALRDARLQVVAISSAVA